VPQDLFDGKPLRMKKTDRGLLIYSIGPDEVDNAGAPMTEQETGDIAFTVVPGTSRLLPRDLNSRMSRPAGGTYLPRKCSKNR
jgi:hypothetical protein